MRVSRDGGRTYPKSTERPLTRELPRSPAAVRVYDQTGMTSCLVGDFDAKAADASAVAREAAAFAQLVRRCGGRTLEDVSPTGGRHVYVPLAEPIPLMMARRLADALARRYPTYDRMPMLHAGSLIRPPGSPHPAGGFQVLTTPTDEVVHVLTVRTPPPAVVKLARALGVDLDIAAAASPAADTSWQAALATAPLKPLRRPLAPEWELMAAQGTWPREWPSPSEARLGFLRACARHGWTLAAVAARLETGQWPHVAALYERYAPHTRRTAMARDWLKATRPDLEKPTSLQPEIGPARGFDTRVDLTHPLPHGHTDTDPAGAVQTWWTVVRELERSRGGWSAAVRKTLRALADAARKHGTTTVSHGLRSMAEAAGLDHATVGLALTTLREEDSPVVVRTRVGELVDADTYELVVPDKHAALTRLRWRSGGIRRIHPLFRVLRGPAFLVWEALAEAGGVPAAVFDVAAATGLSPTAVREALRTFGELGLVEHDGDGWIIVGRLGDAAEQLGADQIAERVRLEHVRDREAWRVVVRRMILREKIAAAWWEQEPPPPTDDPRWEEMDRAVTLFDSAVA